MERMERDSKMTPKMKDYLIKNISATALQIAKDLGITRQSVYEQLKNKVRIAGWVPGGRGQATALYAFGKGYNARKPAPMSQVERSKAYHARHSAIIRARRPSKTSTALGPWKGLI
jgi:predicted ArsR family transcriptional regulator